MYKAITIAFLSFILFTPGANAGARGTLDAGSLTCGGAPSDCGAPSPYFSQSKTTDTCDRPPLPRLPAIRPIMGSSVAYAKSSARETIRIPLSVGPLWAISGAWSPQNNALLINDMQSQSIFFFDLQANTVKEVVTMDLQSGQHRLPTVIRPCSGGYVIEDKSVGRVIKINEHYEIEGETDTINRGQSDTGIVRFIWSWVDIGNEIVAYGDLVHGPRSGWNDPKNWTIAILKLEQSSGDPKVIAEEKTDHNMTRQHARLGGYPVMAAVGKKAYMLMNKGRETIYEISPEYKKLMALPAGLDEFPFLPDEMNGHLPYIFSILEDSEVAVALYGWRDALYLLARRPDVSSKEKTIWRLLKVNPEGGKIIDAIALPTQEPNILLIPGSKWWAIIEKDHVKDHVKDNSSSPQARAQAIVLVPTRDFESGGGPLTDRGISPVGDQTHARRAP